MYHLYVDVSLRFCQINEDKVKVSYTKVLNKVVEFYSQILSGIRRVCKARFRRNSTSVYRKDSERNGAKSIRLPIISDRCIETSSKQYIGTDAGVTEHGRVFWHLRTCELCFCGEEKIDSRKRRLVCLYERPCDSASCFIQFTRIVCVRKCSIRCQYVLAVETATILASSEEKNNR